MHIFIRLLVWPIDVGKKCKSTRNFSFAKGGSKDSHFCQTLYDHYKPLFIQSEIQS